MPSRGIVAIARAFTSSALVLALTPACAARRSEALRGPVALKNPEQARGEQLYMRECDACHPHGEAGLGPPLNNKPLPASAIALQVRKGLGAMPSFNERELSDEDVKAVASYVIALRKSPGR